MVASAIAFTAYFYAAIIYFCKVFTAVNAGVSNMKLSSSPTVQRTKLERSPMKKIQVSLTLVIKVIKVECRGSPLIRKHWTNTSRICV